MPGRAFILETPIDRPGDDRRNVRALWQLVGISVKQAPRAEDGFSMLKAKRAASVKGMRRKTTTRKKTKIRNRKRNAKSK